MRKRRLISFICVMLFALSIVLSYVNIPDTYILYKDRSWSGNGAMRIISSHESVETSQGVVVPRQVGDYKASLSIFGIPYKSVMLKVLEDTCVIPGGQAIGIRLYSDSLIVVAVGRVNKDGKSPGEEAGIAPGDEIIAINNEKVGTPEEFSKKIEGCTGSVVLTVKTGEKTRNVEVTPQVSDYDNIKRVGLWVRDSTAGVGTLTYADLSTMTYGALGHAVSDSDTGVKFSVKEGSIEECSISEIKKGEKGTPGELKGMFYTNAPLLGNITENKTEGIFGNLSEVPEGESLPLGHKSEIKKGKAYIRTSLDGKSVEEYEIEILKVSENTKNPSKGLVIKVTDERLIEKTGGIVQGMSGSPIIQDGKLIGAVTHVLVNDPTKGYGIFIENMLDAAG